MVKYFMYSREQHNIRQQIEKDIGRSFYPGTVIVRGRQKLFTEMISNPKLSRFTDAELVAEGEITEMTYTMPKSE